MSMMPRVDGPKPGPAGLARRGAMAGVCVALLAVGCAAGSHGRSGTSAASPGAAPTGGGQANPPSAAALARGHWSVLAASPLGSRQGPVVAWTGQELLEIGGWGGNAGPAAAGGASGAGDRRGRRRRPGDRLVAVGADAADRAELVRRILRRRRARAGGGPLAGCDRRLAPAPDRPAAAVHRPPDPGPARAGLVRGLLSPGRRPAGLPGRTGHAADHPFAARAAR